MILQPCNVSGGAQPAAHLQNQAADDLLFLEVPAEPVMHAYQAQGMGRLIKGWMPQHLGLMGVHDRHGGHLQKMRSPTA